MLHIMKHFLCADKRKIPFISTSYSHFQLIYFDSYNNTIKTNEVNNLIKVPTRYK